MIIELGSRGDYARAVQRIIGVHPDKVDGVIGPFSEAIMVSWQLRRGVPGDGVFGPVSRAAVEPADFIKAYEGLVLQAYDDQQGPLKDRLLRKVGGLWVRADGRPCVGVPTIGWGSTEPCRRGVEFCTRAEADAWLYEFIRDVLGDVMVRSFPAGKDASCRGAVLSVGYNGGPGAITKLARADFAPAWWHEHPMDHGQTLHLRRREECALYYAGEVT